MTPRNPACYECEGTKSKLHHWNKRDDGTAWCIKCDLELSKAQTAEVYFDHEEKK